MPEREKVIKGLETCAGTNNDGDEGTVGCLLECPYKGSLCIDRLMYDALALLKEQEEVEPIPPTDESDLWKCGNCKHQLFRCTHQRYCEMCGREVKWG